MSRPYLRLRPAIPGNTRSCSRVHGSNRSRLHSRAGERVILGIETSCDDSCAAVVAGPSNLLEEPKISLTNQCRVLSQVVTHQDHFATGGIHPYTAGLSHAANLPTTIAQALSQAGIGPDGRGIDAIAVAQGPGMASSLGVGLTAAKTLAATWNKHIIYIHHMAAHALTPLLTEKDPPEFPYVTLLASGGHTMLVLARSPLNYELLATTSDDSIGDAFDKVARALGIQWGAATNFTNPGAALEHFAAEDTQESNGQDPIVFPVPSPGALSFSYSGIKSAALRYIERNFSTKTTETDSAEVLNHRKRTAQAFQQAAVRQIEDRVAVVFKRRQPSKSETSENLARIGRLPPIRDLVCSGGVASNTYLRQRLASLLSASANGQEQIRIHFPPLSLCTDNATMIAFAAHLWWTRRTHAFDQHARPRWSLEDL